MLRSLLVLVTVGVCLAKVNYKSTKKVISEEEKDRIIAGDDDSAFDEFLSVYDDIEPIGFRGSTTPEELAAERIRQKRIFVRNIQSIREHNKRYARGEESYKMVVNSFAVMDEDNRRMFLGLGKDSIDRRPTGQGLGSSRYTSEDREGGLFNTSDGLPPVTASRTKGRGRGGLGSARAATSLDWRNKLGAIKNQGTCGSCWTYPATALLEFAIQKTKGQKLPLSEQQLLDCTYESQNYNACKGGWYYQAWDYIIKNNNHLASESSYRYKNADGACYASHYSNALSGKIKLNSYNKVPASQVIDKMQISPLAVAFFVDNRFYSIGSGVFDGCYTYYPSNHAVTLTGYGNGYWEIRNSWGGDWGNRGYGRFKRSGDRSICNLLSDVYAISYSGSDGEEVVDPDDCSDNSQHEANCGGWATAGYCDSGDYVQWMADNCKKSCGACEEERVDPDPDPEPEPDDCTDTRTEAECKDWEDNYNYCTTGDYVEWMKINCAKTCGACGDDEREREREKETEEDCEDNSEYAASCPDWADADYCDEGNEYHEWMTTNCAKSCDACDDDGRVDPEPTEETSGDCEDSNAKCSKWAKLEYCDNDDYRDYMRTNCQSSCNSCSDPTDEPTEEMTDPTAQLIPHSKVSQSTTQKVKKQQMVADRAVDGDESTRSQTKCSGKKDAWFKYKFEEESRVSTVEILNGNFDKKRDKLNGALVYVQEVEGLKKKCGEIEVRESSSKTEQTYRIDCGGTYASGIEILQKTKYKNKKCLELKEVKVYGFSGDDSTASSSSSEPTEEATEEGEKEEERNDGCPGGTVRCPDGVCKHIHMCGRG